MSDRRNEFRRPMRVRKSVSPARDMDIPRLIALEEERQRSSITLVPSENYVSPSVHAALGSVLTNRYSEGYPGRRYYGGQQVVDDVERLAQARALSLFLTREERAHWHVNVQPYSGSPANLAVYLALADPGDPIMGLKLTHGGHLTHGHDVSFSGKLFAADQYALHPATHRLDFDAIRDRARELRPKIIVSGATAYPRAMDFSIFQGIAEEVGAVHVADISHVAGLIIGGAHPSPFPYTHVVTTTMHKTLRGPRGAVIFCQRPYAKAIDKAVFPGLQGGPHDHVTAAKAVCFFEAGQPGFRTYIGNVVRNASRLGEELRARGFDLVTGGTDTHLLVLDLRGKGITGTEAEATLERAGIVANKNTIPNDPRSPFDPSGLRIGTPAVTTRGMGEEDMARIASFMDRALSARGDADALARVEHEVRALARAFPPPGYEP